MKNKLLFLLIIVNVCGLFAENSFQLGLSFAAGARYDEVRMCVASPVGYKGVLHLNLLDLLLKESQQILGFGGYIPLGRPLLFGTAFRMLQFLPEAVVSLHIPINDSIDFLTDFGAGASFHYGPDYKSGLNSGDPRSPDFFAVGPRGSLFFGIAYLLQNNIALKVGVRPYVEYLFSDYLSGFVAGGELDIQVRFLIKT